MSEKSRRAWLRRHALAVVAERDEYRCGICAAPVDMAHRGKIERFPDGTSVYRVDRGIATIDHIVPVSAGGSDDLHNLQLAHHGCNARKGVRPA